VYAGTIVGVDARETTADALDGLRLLSYTASANEHPDVGTNQVLEPSGDSFVAIGRWGGGTTAGKFYQAGNMGLLDLPANGGFQYAIGNGTSTLPSSGATSYTLLDTTSATVSDGSLSPGTVSGTLAANLAGSGTKVGFSLTLNLPGDTTYTITTTGGTANPATSEAMLAPFFTGGFSATLPMSGGAACQNSSSCFAIVDGFFAGANADRVALVAHVYSGAGGTPKSVSGAAVFKR
jgi:hypothetical protein